MWKTTLITLVCIGFVLESSFAAATTTTPTKTATKTKATVKTTGTTQKPAAVTQKPAAVTQKPAAVTQKHNAQSTVTTKPVTTTQPKQYNCKEFHCIGKDCYANSTLKTTVCKDNFCVISAFKNGNQIELGGDCAQTCTEKVSASNTTHCCTANNCNIDKKEVSKALQFSGAVLWTVNLLFLFIMQATAFAMHA